MSINTEIGRINGNISGAYSAAQSMGATIPTDKNSANLAGTIRSIPQEGGGIGGGWVELSRQSGNDTRDLELSFSDWNDYTQLMLLFTMGVTSSGNYENFMITVGGDYESDYYSNSFLNSAGPRNFYYEMYEGEFDGGLPVWFKVIFTPYLEKGSIFIESNGALSDYSYRNFNLPMRSGIYVGDRGGIEVILPPKIMLSTNYNTFPFDSEAILYGMPK